MLFEAVPNHRRPLRALLLCGLLSLAACSEQVAGSSARGAAGGGVAGAVGGMVTALVFGDNVGEAVARSAVFGASAGAAAGAASGVRAEKAAAEQRAAEEARVRQKIGDEAYAGLAALAKCDHKAALGHATAAQGLPDADFALAGRWLEILTLADQRQEAAARDKFPALVAADPGVADANAAEAKMRRGGDRLREIRAEYKLPTVCAA